MDIYHLDINLADLLCLTLLELSAQYKTIITKYNKKDDVSLILQHWKK